MERTVKLWHRGKEYNLICTILGVEDNEKHIHVVFSDDQLAVFRDVINDALEGEDFE